MGKIGDTGHTVFVGDKSTRGVGGGGECISAWSRGVAEGAVVVDVVKLCVGALVGTQRG